MLIFDVINKVSVEIFVFKMIFVKIIWIGVNFKWWWYVIIKILIVVSKLLIKVMSGSVNIVIFVVLIKLINKIIVKFVFVLMFKILVFVNGFWVIFWRIVLFKFKVVFVRIVSIICGNWKF